MTIYNFQLDIFFLFYTQLCRYCCWQTSDSVTNQTICQQKPSVIIVWNDSFWVTMSNRRWTNQLADGSVNGTRFGKQPSGNHETISVIQQVFYCLFLLHVYRIGMATKPNFWDLQWQHGWSITIEGFKFWYQRRLYSEVFLENWAGKL